jgi:hypothetical protein
MGKGVGIRLNNPIPEGPRRHNTADGVEHIDWCGGS